MQKRITGYVFKNKTLFLFKNTILFNFAQRGPQAIFFGEYLAKFKLR